MIYFNKRYVWRGSNEQFQNDSAAIIDQLNDSLKKELQLHQNEKIINYLKKHYSETFIQKAYTLIQQVQCKPQQLIYKSGQVDDIAIYMIEKGKVEVFYKTKSIKNSTSQQHFISEINEGQIFGIRNFYTGKAFDLNLRACGFVSLLRIKRDEFIHMLEQFPDDRESFCHIRDNITLYSDGWKSNSSCPSCGSYKHHLTDCDFVHYVPHKQNICLRHSYIPPNSHQIERQKLQSVKREKKMIDDLIVESDESEEIRKRGRQNTRYDLPQYMEQLYFDYIEFIEEYYNKYLCYKFKYSYITQDKQDTDEDDDQLSDEDGFIQFQKEGEGSMFQFARQITNSIDQSAIVQFDQNSDAFDKQISNQYERQKSVLDGSPIQKKNMSPARVPGKEQNSKQQNPQCIFKGPRKQGQNLHQPMNSPSMRNSYRPKSVIFSEALEKQYPPSEFSKMSTEQQKNTENSNGGNDQIQQVKTSTINTYIPANSSNPFAINPQTTSYVNNQNTSQFHQNLSQFNQNPSQFNQNIAQSLFKVDDVQNLPVLQLSKIISTEQNQSPSLQNKQPQLQYSFSVQHQNMEKNLQPYTVARNQDKKNSSIKKAFSIKMKKFQNNIIENIEKIFQKNGQTQFIKNESIGEVNKDFIGSQQIFRNFDKQKNFYVYFPFNNLNYLLMKIEMKSQIGKKIYLDILSQKKKQPYGLQQSSSHTLFLQKYEKLKLKSDRMLNKGMRGNTSSIHGSSKQKTVDYDHPNQDSQLKQQQQQQQINVSVQRKSAFFDQTQIESPVGSLNDKQIQLFSAKSFNNNRQSIQGLFSRNDESFEINNPRFNGSELSPNIKDMDFSSPSLNDIHRIQFQAKKFSFNYNI